MELYFWKLEVEMGWQASTEEENIRLFCKRKVSAYKMQWKNIKAPYLTKILYINC